MQHRTACVCSRMRPWLGVVRERDSPEGTHPQAPTGCWLSVVGGVVPLDLHVEARAWGWGRGWEGETEGQSETHASPGSEGSCGLSRPSWWGHFCFYSLILGSWKTHVTPRVELEG